MDEALKPCPFCGSPPMPDYCSTTDGPAYSFHCHAKDCPAWPNVQGETEAEAIAAWNTRADAAPTPRADEVEAVGFAMWKAEADRAAPNVGKNRTIENYRYDLDPIGRAKWDQIAQAAAAVIAADRAGLVAEIERLREVAITIHGALAAHTCYGCPACHGDCSSANPPMMFCPTAQARAAYFMFDHAVLKDTCHD